VVLKKQIKNKSSKNQGIFFTNTDSTSYFSFLKNSFQTILSHKKLFFISAGFFLSYLCLLLVLLFFGMQVLQTVHIQNDYLEDVVEPYIYDGNELTYEQSIQLDVLKNNFNSSIRLFIVAFIVVILFYSSLYFFNQQILSKKLFKKHLFYSGLTFFEKIKKALFIIFIYALSIGLLSFFFFVLMTLERVSFLFILYIFLSAIFLKAVTLHFVLKYFSSPQSLKNLSTKSLHISKKKPETFLYRIKRYYVFFFYTALLFLLLVLVVTFFSLLFLSASLVFSLLIFIILLSFIVFIFDVVLLLLSFQTSVSARGVI
jgi:hypothetical protein